MEFETSDVYEAMSLMEQASRKLSKAEVLLSHSLQNYNEAPFVEHSIADTVEGLRSSSADISDLCSILGYALDYFNI